LKEHGAVAKGKDLSSMQYADAASWDILASAALAASRAVFLVAC
jgi:hypothetical protein